MRIPLSVLLVVFILIAGEAQAEQVFGKDLVFPAKGFGRPHGASLVELENGDLLATWFSSKVETSSDAEIFGARWEKKKGKWSLPFTIIPSDYTKSLGNTALFKDDDGNIWLFFASVVVGGWSGAMVDYVVSKDDGKTWSEGERLVGWPGNLPRNPPIKVGDHQMLVPLFVDFWYEVGLVGSYTALLTYKEGKITAKQYASIESTDAIQPTIVKLPDKRILLLARDKSDRFIRRAYSTDNGKSWLRETMTTLPNPGSAICAIYIDNIGTLLAYNHSRRGRNPLSLAVSGDGGDTFARIADLEFKPGNNDAAFAYPAMIQTGDGMIHAIWSHDERATLKHVYFNIDWLKERIERPEILSPAKLVK